MFSSTQVLAGLLSLSVVWAVALDLCSSVNLGSASFSNEYMSNGLCSDHCSDQGFSAAITQGYLCYCSNAVPADTVSLNQCNTGCPGYSQQENCGGDGLFGYIKIGNPSTSSASSSATSDAESQAKSDPTTSTTSTTSSTTVTSKSTSSTSTSSTSTPQSPSSSPKSSSQAQDSSTSSPEESSSESSPSAGSSARNPSSSRPETSKTSSASQSSSSGIIATTVVSIMTVDGSTTASVLTKYITETPSASASASPSHTAKSKQSFFDSKGKVAGTFTAVGVVVAALVCTLLYCCCCGAWSNRKTYDDEMQSTSDESLFTNEKTVALSGNMQTPTSPPIKRNSSSKSILSIFNTATGPNGAPASSVGRSLSKKKLNPRNEPAQGGPMMFSIMEFDNVMDPALDVPSEHNMSKLSLNDDEDYSNAYQDRALHIANPE